MMLYSAKFKYIEYSINQINKKHYGGSFPENLNISLPVTYTGVRALQAHYSLKTEETSLWRTKHFMWINCPFIPPFGCKNQAELNWRL